MPVANSLLGVLDKDEEMLKDFVQKVRYRSTRKPSKNFYHPFKWSDNETRSEMSEMLEQNQSAIF